MHRKEFHLTEKSTATTHDSVGAWVISSSNYDRVNDRIMLPALKSQVGKDVLCLWQHSPDQPIGRWTNLRMKGDKLVADLILAKTNLGLMIRELLAVQTPLGASIGFRGKAKQNDKGGFDFNEISLMETSIVSVPCNEDAMAIAKSFGISPETLVSVTGDEEPSASSGNSPDALIRAKAAILAANRAIRK